MSDEVLRDINDAKWKSYNEKKQKYYVWYMKGPSQKHLQEMRHYFRRKL